MTSDVRYEIKETSLPVIWLEILTLDKSGFVHELQLILVPGWSGRWWRLKRSSTNWSFFNKWSWNWFRCNPSPQTSGFQPDFVSRLLVWNFGIQLDFFETPLRPALVLCPIIWSRLQVRILVSGIETRFGFRNPDSYPYPKQLCVQDLNLKIEN
jgi:hypothetical protein